MPKRKHKKRSNGRRKSVNNHNFASNTCGGCELVHYCTEQCQLSHWKKWKMSYKQRINKIFGILNKMCIQNDEQKCVDVYDIVHAQYQHNGGINQFIKDYAHYIRDIDKHKDHHKYHGHCELNNCSSIKREYRNREIYDKNMDKLQELYSNTKDENGMFIQQLLDQMHVSRYHLVDMGMRCTSNADATERITDLLMKRKRFNAIRGDMSNDEKTPNKFVTEVIQNEDGNLPSYWSGVRFFYHEFYKDIHEPFTGFPAIANPKAIDAGNMHHAGKIYTISDWFIVPKYKNIKEEVINLQNPNSISITQYNYTIKKCIMKYKALSQNIRTMNRTWVGIYKIADGTIKLYHIFAILLYCNYTKLSASFSKSFRKLTATETDLCLKQRHSNFANWARALRETIEGYGIYFSESNIDEFYHGISSKMSFDGFVQKFCAPTSTTLRFEIAQTFASQSDDDGIIITLKNDKQGILYFNCSDWSDFGHESEMLFVAGIDCISMTGLYSMTDNQHYDDWIQSMQIFQSGFIAGKATLLDITNKHQKQIRLLVDDKINNNIDNIPFYVKQLFANMLKKIKCISIEIGMLNKKIKLGHFYGYKSLKDLYLNEHNQIKWQNIQYLFPSLIGILIGNVNMTNDDDRIWLPSIKIDTSFLDGMFQFLSNTTQTINFINVYYPKNNKQHINQIMDQYESSFDVVQFGMNVSKYKHPSVLGDCDHFCVERKCC